MLIIDSCRWDTRWCGRGGCIDLLWLARGSSRPTTSRVDGRPRSGPRRHDIDCRITPRQQLWSAGWVLPDTGEPNSIRGTPVTDFDECGGIHQEDHRYAFPNVPQMRVKVNLHNYSCRRLLDRILHWEHYRYADTLRLLMSNQLIPILQGPKHSDQRTHRDTNRPRSPSLSAGESA